MYIILILTTEKYEHNVPFGKQKMKIIENTTLYIKFNYKHYGSIKDKTRGK